jgi:alpha-beta hydrolase superfamily lysophospholipase
MRPVLRAEGFELRDGALLPVRTWLPEGTPRAIVLALHGFNDSRNGWEMPAPAFTAAGLALVAPDQRGFGGAPGRGLWPGRDVLVDDAADMVTALKARFAGARLFLMGESMGAAVLMRLATRDAPAVDGYVLLAPAVWGRARMNPFMQAGLWLGASVVPGMEVSRPPPWVHIYASDNAEAIRRLVADPLTIRATRMDTLRGLVDLMDDALAAAPAFRERSLFLYGERDMIVPEEATLATWRSLPAGPRRALYPNGWHLLLRDLDRAVPIADAVAWIGDPAGPLPSAAESRAARWLAEKT